MHDGIFLTYLVQVVARDVELQDFMAAVHTTPRTVSAADTNLYLEFSQTNHHS